MKRWSFLVSLVVLLTASGAAFGAGSTTDVEVPDVVTYHEHVEPIFQASCQGCHRPEGAVYGGMKAPMAFVDYKDVRPWAKSIARQVQSRDMPPWFASDHTKGQFLNERELTEQEVATIVRWAQTGAAKGDPALAPEPLDWTRHEGWLIGEPDLVIDLNEPFWVSDDVRDINISLKAEMITAEMLPEPRWVAAMEFRAGSEAVHHIVASKSAENAELPGASGMLGGMAPGSEPFFLPEGVGRLLVPNTQVYMQMHYNKEPGEGTGMWDHSQIAFKFHPEDAVIDKVATWRSIGNSAFEIPPNQERWMVGASKIFEYDTTVYALLPHMHLRGKEAKYTAYYPDGTSELLLHVPEYDWNWQTNYQYREPLLLPAGTRIELAMWFDNTEARNEVTELELDVNRAVRFGGPTTDEMMLGFMDYAEHRNENTDLIDAVRADEAERIEAAGAGGQ